MLSLKAFTLLIFAKLLIASSDCNFQRGVSVVIIPYGHPCREQRAGLDLEFVFGKVGIVSNVYAHSQHSRSSASFFNAISVYYVDAGDSVTVPCSCLVAFPWWKSTAANFLKMTKFTSHKATVVQAF